MTKYEVGYKVKLRKDSTHHHQAPDLFGEIVKINESLIHSYRVKFSNGYENSYRLIHLELVEAKTLTREEVVAEAIRRYSPIKIGDKFKPISTTLDYTFDDTVVKSDKPEEWTFYNSQLFLAKDGDGGSRVYSNGKWAEKITEPFTLPEKWAVECNVDCSSTPELLDWRLNKSDIKCKWIKKGYIRSNGYHCGEYHFYTLITYQQFIDHVYNPWKSTQTVIDHTIKVGDMVEVIHTSPREDEWVGDCVGFYTENDKKGKSWCFDNTFLNKPDGLELLPIGSDNDIDVHVPHASAMFDVTNTNGTVSITNTPVKSKNSIEDVPSINVLLKPKKKIKLKID